MRIGAEWIYDKEGFTGGDEPAWLGIGWITADLGGILLLITIILAWVFAVRGERRREPGAHLRATIIATLVLIAYLVTVWAMAGKPE